jgi:ATP-dependent Lon protease
MMTWTDEALDYIIEYYTMEAGVRELRRKIGTIDRKYAVDFLRDPSYDHLVVDKEVVKKYLGAEIFVRDKNINDSQIGVINGLAYTQAGGETLKIEVNTFPGKGALILTGNLGDVMKEACETALSYVKSIGPDVGINPEFFNAHDIHIHFPESATPKDGPSAGVATVLCILSAVCQLRIRNDVAMTGEVDLRGNAMPIGGLREKCNAAAREHIKTVFVPYENDKDVKELPKEIADALEIVEVKKVSDLFKGVYLEDITTLKDEIYKATSPKKADEDKTSEKKSTKKVSK